MFPLFLKITTDVLSPSLSVVVRQSIVSLPAEDVNISPIQIGSSSTSGVNSDRFL